MSAKEREEVEAFLLACPDECMLKDCPFSHKRVINRKNWKHVRIPIFLITTTC